MILRLQKSQEQRQNANTAFYAGATSEFDVVGYNEDWVAIWSEGGVDESAVQSDNVEKKTVLLLQAGNLPYILCREKIVIF